MVSIEQADIIKVFTSLRVISASCCSVFEIPFDHRFVAKTVNAEFRRSVFVLWGVLW